MATNKETAHHDPVCDLMAMAEREVSAFFRAVTETLRFCVDFEGLLMEAAREQAVLRDPRATPSSRKRLGIQRRSTLIKLVWDNHPMAVIQRMSTMAGDGESREKPFEQAVKAWRA